MINWNRLSPNQQAEMLARPAINDSKALSDGVAQIIERVKKDGDKALFELTEQFDGVRLNRLSLAPEAVNRAREALSEKRLAAIDTAYIQIRAFHQAQITDDISVETCPGVTCTLKSEAIDSVGLYIPAGTAPLPSTVLMLGIPAQLAGCRRVVLTCPPDSNGQLANEILYAAQICGITEIYTLGGAQAITALALGTNSIAPVNKVFGPGNRFVTEAKKQLSQQVPGFAIDMPAGPSELLVIADQTATPAFVAADLLSQAEHGEDSQVLLVTDSEPLIEQVTVEIAAQLKQLSRRDIAAKALENSRLILCRDIDQAIDVSNQYGPEHLCVQTEVPRKLLARLRSAGSIFLGDYAPESAGDYASGTNHVLPTYGYSKVIGSLSLADFTRRFTVQELTRDGLAQLAPAIIELTNAEGLDAHQRAVTIRLEQSQGAKS